MNKMTIKYMIYILPIKDLKRTSALHRCGLGPGGSSCGDICFHTVAQNPK